MIWCVTLNPALDVAYLVPEGIGSKDVAVAQTTDIRAGGKGNNVARTVKVLGGTVSAVGVFGGAVGAAIIQKLEDSGIAVWSAWIPEESRICMTLTSDEGLPVEVRGRGPRVSPPTVTELLERLSQAVGPEDWVALSGSLPPGLPTSTYAEWISVLKPRVAGVVLDTAGEALRQGYSEGPTAIVPNSQEFLELAVGRDGLGESDVEVIVTEGGDGVTWHHRSARRRWEAPQVRVRNPVGAGDVFLGAMLKHLHDGMSWDMAIPWAVASASASVETLGVAEVNIARISILHDTLREAKLCH